MIKQKLLGIDELMKDNEYQGMGFNPADYGEDNKIIRQCDMCKKKFNQGNMAELSCGSQFGSGKNQLYSDGIFICEKCWNKKYRWGAWQA